MEIVGQNRRQIFFEWEFFLKAKCLSRTLNDAMITKKSNRNGSYQLLPARYYSHFWMMKIVGPLFLHHHICSHFATISKWNYFFIKVSVIFHMSNSCHQNRSPPVSSQSDIIHIKSKCIEKLLKIYVKMPYHHCDACGKVLC